MTDSAALRRALDTVIDPELRRPITELGMVESAQLNDGTAQVKVLLTIAGCPMRSTIESDVTTAVAAVAGVQQVEVTLGVMDPHQRAELRDRLKAKRTVFSDPDSLTRIIAVASGKGGVGKSSVTANLAAAMAANGLNVGLIDADVHGFSIPSLMGITQPPTRVDEMILPPVAHGVKVISIGMFLDSNQPVIWRGPMLHRALEQFLTDVYFGDLDVLLLDLPPGTGDMAISVSQLLPNSELLVITTPQSTATQVAERAGTIALQTKQKVIGVVENMSYLSLPDGSKMEIFGTGGGQRLSESLSSQLQYSVPLLAQLPLEEAVRVGSDQGVPVVLSTPESPVAQSLRELAIKLGQRPRGLAGRSLPMSF
ncbi:Mrp/NBP35 family ATP-binding protein [Glutamicibacter sp. BW77]|uniref:Iron-sulfur cluster carrier protein n=1 Tax=Glutamicibacter bergerei TaxID=256702 RepID=A0ABV9MMP9_9MICC|nr:Mrp/NBP35 family ATP-binding protein [Glutamicibacter sp. BW77]PCC34565.1 sodium:proton antiporter [Glutamicibacter sp. BW77]HBV08507.1 MRP family ATP-binding protein [Micrococcaceae bacterium]